MAAEKLLTVKEACAWLRENLGISREPVTVYGWIYYGAGGAQLEAISVGGRWHTTAGALKRFFLEQTRRQAPGTVRELEL